MRSLFVLLVATAVIGCNGASANKAADKPSDVVAGQPIAPDEPTANSEGEPRPEGAGAIGVSKVSE